MRQLSALPVKITDLDPCDLGTADAACFGTGDNGLDYLIKTIDRTPLVPAAEFICHSLAEACGIATPQFHVVELHDGSQAFGSVWDRSAANDISLIEQILVKQLGRQVEQNVARIFTLDMFVHNTDRHGKNYLCVPGRTDGHALKAFDFSRAFIVHGWPLPSLPMPGVARTIEWIQYICRHRKFDVVAANAMLSRIRDLPFEPFKSLVDQLPRAWLDANSRAKMKKWWAQERAARISAIEDGIKNGTLF